MKIVRNYWHRVVAVLIVLIMLLSLIAVTRKVEAATGTITYNGKISYGAATVGSFTVNGRQAFCLEHEKGSPPSGTTFYDEIYNNSDILKVLYYGWEGPAQWSGFENSSHGIVATSLVLSHYYSGTPIKASARTFYEFLQTQPSVPQGVFELSKSLVQAYLTDDKTGQRTENITFDDAAESYIDLKLPSGVTLYNMTRKTSATGTVRVNGGDTFYLGAPLSQNGTWSSGKLPRSMGDYQAVVCVTEASSLQNLGQGVFADDPSRTIELTVKWIPHGKIALSKVDAETGEGKPQGAGSLEGAVYEVYNTVGVKCATLQTDAEGKAVSDLLPYDTYTVKEKSASEGYLVQVSDSTCILNKDIVDITSREQVQRGDLSGVKIGSGSHKRLAGVPFEIRSNTTGESHLVVTDKNGSFSTASSWTAHTQNTNQGVSSEDGVWFGQSDPDDSLGALPYDTYTVTELACESNEGYQLIPPFEVTVYRDKQVINLGTLTDESPEIPEEPEEPEEPKEISIHTKAANPDTGKQVIQAEDRQTVVDTVSLSGLVVGHEYELTGWEMVKQENAALLVDGKRVENNLKFTADAEEMEVQLAFVVDARDLGGKDLVTFEQLKGITDPEEQAEHKDIEDEGQTVTVEGKESPKPEEPAEPEKPEKPVNKPPKTGDAQGIAVWLLLMAAGAVTGAVAAGIRRKRKADPAEDADTAQDPEKAADAAGAPGHTDLSADKGIRQAKTVEGEITDTDQSR